MNNNKSLTVQGLNAINSLTNDFTTQLDHNLIIESLIRTYLSEGGRFDILKVKMSLAVLDDDKHYNINTPTIRIEGGVVTNASKLSYANKAFLIKIGFTLIG